MPTKTEKCFVNEMTDAGWEVWHNGFPDFVCQKNGSTILVEIKATKKEPLRRHQHNTLTILEHRDLSCFVWSPDNKQLIPLSLCRAQVATKIKRNGHPGVKNEELNERIRKAWASGRYKSYSALARVFRTYPKKVQRAVLRAKAAQV